jgi:TRAP-type C4-dicarboxylate transport system permease large subunit
MPDAEGPVAIGERFSRRFTFDAESIRQFAALCGDANPLHHDAAAAARGPFGTLIASGPQTASLMMGLNATFFCARFDALGLGWVGFLLVANLFFLFLGCIMDAVPAMLIFFPVLLPVAKGLGIDPIHFGVVVVLNLMIGLLTPPVGALLFLEAKIADISFESLVRSVAPYLVALLAVLALITYLPPLVTFVPNLVFGRG